MKQFTGLCFPFDIVLSAKKLQFAVDAGNMAKATLII
jgi:hypothetical protein